MFFYDPKPQTVASFDLVEWDDSELEASSELDAPLEPKVDLDGVLVSVCSSSNRRQ